jgi:RNA polymerase sigma-70 factor (ECF subfamily)
MLAVIANLPEAEGEAFDLVRIQGLTQAEAGQVLGVSAATVNRRLNRGLELLAEALSDLRPDQDTGIRSQQTGVSEDSLPDS